MTVARNMVQASKCAEGHQSKPGRSYTASPQIVGREIEQKFFLVAWAWDQQPQEGV
jgi:hypothetical protein